MEVCSTDPLGSYERRECTRVSSFLEWLLLIYRYYIPSSLVAAVAVAVLVLTCTSENWEDNPRRFLCQRVLKYSGRIKRFSTENLETMAMSVDKTVCQGGKKFGLVVHEIFMRYEARRLVSIKTDGCEQRYQSSGCFISGSESQKEQKKKSVEKLDENKSNSPWR
ncbi:hypothetical protein KQX54_002691 [Cotesia glomerata]|uniref:Uncharacterized protein n=1 Tax=Cotesia glomerata TaxID=32391 RepID=A0AAV7J4B8_COTGL|nr:hypothetical protein KQX54_002691 [Cotesia glomerata]